jgi:hypothetical protein
MYQAHGTSKAIPNRNFDGLHYIRTNIMNVLLTNILQQEVPKSTYVCALSFKYVFYTARLAINYNAVMYFCT